MSNKSHKNLYRAGRQYAKRIKNLRDGGISPRAAELQIAENQGIETEQVRTAVAFAAAVDQIVGNCGSKSRQLLLSGISRLPVQTVMQIKRTHPDRQRFALAQAEAGRNPFGKPSGTAPPFDTLGYSEVLSRLARNAGLLDHVARGLLDTQRVNWPDDDCLRKCSESLKEISSVCRRLTTLMKRSGGKIREQKGSPEWEARKAPKPFNTSSTYRQIRSVHGIAEKNLRDLPRLLKESPPNGGVVAAVLKALANLRASAGRLASVIRTRSHKMRTGFGCGARHLHRLLLSGPTRQATPHRGPGHVRFPGGLLRVRRNRVRRWRCTKADRPAPDTHLERAVEHRLPQAALRARRPVVDARSRQGRIPVGRDPWIDAPRVVSGSRVWSGGQRRGRSPSRAFRQNAVVRRI